MWKSVADAGEGNTALLDMFHATHRDSHLSYQSCVQPTSACERNLLCCISLLQANENLHSTECQVLYVYSPIIFIVKYKLFHLHTYL